MTTIQAAFRSAALALQSIDWALVGRRCRLAALWIAAVLVVLGRLIWKHRHEIRSAVVGAVDAAIGAVIAAVEHTYQAGCWTRCAVLALTSQQSLQRLAPITNALAAAREALERLVRHLYPGFAV